MHRSWTHAKNLESLSRSRQAIADAATGLLEDSRLQDLQLVVHELVSNAIRHGMRDGRVEVEIWVSDGLTTVRVGDRGEGFRPGVHREGVGLGIVRALGASYQIERTEDGMVHVWLSMPTGGDTERTSSPHDDLLDAGAATAGVSPTTAPPTTGSNPIM